MEFINLHLIQSKMIEKIDNHMVGGSIADLKILGQRLCHCCITTWEEDVEKFL